MVVSHPFFFGDHMGFWDLFGGVVKEYAIDYPAYKREVYALLKKDYPNDGDRLPFAAKKLVDSIIWDDFRNNISRTPEATWMTAYLALMSNGIYLS
jgi:hypothetical protein